MAGISTAISVTDNANSVAVTEATLGKLLGAELGLIDGLILGDRLGLIDGLKLGDKLALGDWDGEIEGENDGDALGDKD